MTEGDRSPREETQAVPSIECLVIRLSTDYWALVVQVWSDLPATEKNLAQFLQLRPLDIHYLTVQVRTLSSEYEDL